MVGFCIRFLVPVQRVTRARPACVLRVLIALLMLSRSEIASEPLEVRSAQ